MCVVMAAWPLAVLYRLRRDASLSSPQDNNCRGIVAVKARHSPARAGGTGFSHTHSAMGYPPRRLFFSLCVQTRKRVNTRARDFDFSDVVAGLFRERFGDRGLKSHRGMPMVKVSLWGGRFCGSLEF